MKCRHLEELVTDLKKQFIERVVKAKRDPIDLDAIMAQRMEDM